MTSQAGRPTTFEYEPSMPDTRPAPRPWMAYAPALSVPSPLATYARTCSAVSDRKVTRVFTVSSCSAHGGDSGAPIAKRVHTSCVFPASRPIICSACSAPEGLPRISSSAITEVSATSTAPAADAMLIPWRVSPRPTAADLANGTLAAASLSPTIRMRYASGVSPGRTDSSTSTDVTRVGTPRLARISRRRGDPLARRSGSASESTVRIDGDFRAIGPTFFSQ